MAAVQIQFDQAAHPPGVPGQAREDLQTGLAVTATAVGGPYLAYLWSFIHRPIDIFIPAEASTLITLPGSAVTSLTPIDVAGTYLLQVVVDSGSGLGALPDDVATLTFYAGELADPLNAALNADPAELPRRRIAFREELEHNVPDAISPLGNPEGWSREWYRWFALLQRLYAGKSWARGRVSLPGGGPATLVRGFNVAGVVRIGVGIVDVTFNTPLPDALYAASASARGAPGYCFVSNEAPGTFRVHRADIGGALVDADFTFDVGLGVT